MNGSCVNHHSNFIDYQQCACNIKVYNICLSENAMNIYIYKDIFSKMQERVHVFIPNARAPEAIYWELNYKYVSSWTTFNSET